jgi:Zn finger protein HypA/HybF involved in hydrogenase expression
MTTEVATWRCKCGVTVKVITEADRSRIIEDRHEAQCPNCGDAQTVYADRILEVTMYNDQTAPQ